MTLLYKISLYLYYILIQISALFGNSKAKLWLKGRKQIFSRIASALKPNEKRIWIHASSLGEFEQGRPIIERIKELHPEYKIFLTFFSPSGYEIRKDYKGADYIFYLPLDRRTTASRFLELVQPEIAVFIKYEFWYYFLNGLKTKNIPAYLVSANFRKEQHFFSWYGGWFRKLLFSFEHIFVQNESSLTLLKGIGLDNVTIAGDTRFDRVYSIATHARELPEVNNFVDNSFCIVAGSTWEPDEELLIRYLNETSHPVKVILAPHEIKEQSIENIIQRLNRKTVRYSRLSRDGVDNAEVLIIDNIGMLSSLYRYGRIAYIGGGFGKGIHNILEAATYGLPILFGPNHQKFQEAVDLIKAGGAFPISDYTSVKAVLDELIENKDRNNICSQISKQFVENNLGATNIILEALLK
ncbi:MAG TPA: glycosyltransferase N-terminal domain-containing protein [Bacteroidales bacterium]|nr:glycosyltransferase N-terminal domain-containing protein [Bacteroidales bacterium]